MYLHIERNVQMHNSVPMINDVLAACNDFVTLNGSEISVDGVEMYKVNDDYRLSLVTDETPDLKPHGRVTVTLVGEGWNWEVEGDFASVTADDGVKEILVEGIEGIKKRGR